jgi:glycosyltransferase involved in cell wall biosynthesis
MEPPFITVLITGYNRKQFIRDAIQSYKDQISSISRELIVITNFSDKEIDEFVNSRYIYYSSKGRQSQSRLLWEDR